MDEKPTRPPEKEVAAPATETATHQRCQTAAVLDDSAAGRNKPGTSLVWVPCTGPRAPQDRLSQHRRRRDAAHRSVPLDCGCRDPWPCDCTDPPLSDRMIDAGKAAAEHLLCRGHTPILEIEILQALWRRGGEDRRLAQHIHQLTDGAIA